MGWLTENWFWILTFLAFVAMHLFGQGGHGGGDRRLDVGASETDGSKSRAANNKSGGHQH